MLRAEEMLALTDLRDRDIEFFIDPFAVAGEAQFNWRADPGVSGDSPTRMRRSARKALPQSLTWVLFLPRP